MIVRLAFVNGTVIESFDLDTDDLDDLPEGDCAVGLVDGTTADAALWAVIETCHQVRREHLTALEELAYSHEETKAAVAFLLETNRWRSITDAVANARKVNLQQVTAAEYAKEWLEMLADGHLGSFASYQKDERQRMKSFFDDVLRYLDFEAYGKMLDDDGSIAVFEFNDEEYVCTNPQEC